MSFNGLLQYLPVLPLVYTIPLIIIGLVFAFFGRVIFYYLLFILGGIVVGGGLALVFFLTGKDVSYVLLGGIGGFIGGGILVIIVFRLVLFLIGALIGGIAGLVIIPNNVLVLLALAVICGIVFIFLFDALLSVATAIQGGAIVGVSLLLSGVDITTVAIVAIMIIIIGLIFQTVGPVKKMKTRGRDPRKKQKSWNTTKNDKSGGSRPFIIGS